MYVITPLSQMKILSHRGMGFFVPNVTQLSGKPGHLSLSLCLWPLCCALPGDITVAFITDLTDSS